MRGVHDVVAWLRDLPAGWVAVLALVENAALVAVTAVLGHWALRLPGAHRVTAPPGPVSRLELGLVAAATVLNAGVTVAGWWLWRAGVITLTWPPTWRALLDLLWDRLFGTPDPDHDARRTGAVPFADTTAIGIPTASPAG